LNELFTDYFSTVLGPDEILTGISVPTAAPGTTAVYLKYTPRSADDYATVAVAGTMRRDVDGLVSSVRLALGGVEPIPHRPRGVETALIGAAPTRILIEEACRLVVDEVAPLDDARGSAEYKRKMAVVWLNRAVSRLIAD
jgi:CO/xanthine dehydrogenase FAD-binding subunit